MLLDIASLLIKKFHLKNLKNLHTLPDQPEAIPYVTSYYKKRWGFCITYNQLSKLREGEYEVFIDSELKNGSLTYGELIIPGEISKEIFSQHMFVIHLWQIMN